MVAWLAALPYNRLFQNVCFAHFSMLTLFGKIMPVMAERTITAVDQGVSIAKQHAANCVQRPGGAKGAASGKRLWAKVLQLAIVVSSSRRSGASVQLFGGDIRAFSLSLPFRECDVASRPSPRSWIGNADAVLSTGTSTFGRGAVLVRC
jgi:hypothetical protein